MLHMTAAHIVAKKTLWRLILGLPVTQVGTVLPVQSPCLGMTARVRQLRLLRLTGSCWFFVAIIA